MIISPVSSKTGQIQTNGLFYTVYTGGTSYAVKQWKAVPAEWRMYFNYDTSVLPSGINITKVEFYHTHLLSSTPPPLVWKTEFFMGTFIGAVLDQSDWNGGASVAVESAPGWPSTRLVNLGSKGIIAINKTGFTDLRLSDASLWDYSSPANWSYTIYSNSARGGRLKITYDFIAIAGRGKTSGNP
jgi:hypothetical protein